MEKNSILKRSSREGKVSRRELQEAYTQEDIKHFMISHPSDMTVLMALYMHRRLTAEQLGRVAFPGFSEYGVKNRMNILNARKVVKRDNRLIRLRGNPLYAKYHYSLNQFGLRVLTDYMLLPFHDDQQENNETPRQHYTTKELEIKRQLDHHYAIQDVVTRIVGELREDNLHVPNCEWRRFPFADENRKIPYRPDWLLFKPNRAYSESMERGEYYRIPFVYPGHVHTSSKQAEKYADFEIDIGGEEAADIRPLNQIREGYEPWICLECDTGTMRGTMLPSKWEAIKTNVKLKQGLVYSIFTPMAKFIDIDIVRNDRTRIGNVRKSAIKSLEKVLLTDEVQMIQGDEFQVYAATKELIKNGGFTNGQAIADVSQIEKLLQQYSLILSKHKLGLANQDSLETLKKTFKPRMPAEPDFVIFKSSSGGYSESEGDYELHFIFMARLGWLNSHVKALAFQEWSKKTPLQQVKHFKIVLMYPNADEMKNDVFLPAEKEIYCVDFQMLQERGMWGTMYTRISIYSDQWDEVIV